ncbi:hypothetical protein G3N95_23085 [Paraburkholderia sp. Tr-20389]|uniref:hypothetical protein n=1 Tax=Paraburkholderia sp. Tr-20389 TaxID=2703903 RepID=UPI00197FA0D1|nr:hypothetical protein [Paraburkholderia sp. Tr-20389]MBN3755848.1 hypothetical protein [Paraburkholderia sp. Tr-20389]
MFIHRHPRRPSPLTGRLGALALAALFCLSPVAVEKTAHATTVSGQIQISLTIRDVCTLNTDAPQPQVACSADAPFRVYQGNYFASPDAQGHAVFAATARNTPVEIAF